MMLSDRELWARANHYITQYQEDAAVMATMRADELLAAGDKEGTLNFQAIVRRMNQLFEPSTGALQ
jgi:hypothetical protein